MKRGQTLVEFALVSMIMLFVVLGLVDFGFLFAGRIGAYQATRAAVRFGAVNPTAWTAASTPTANTIEGRLELTGIPARVPNDDAHLTISYLVPGAGAATVCGSWSATANAFQAQVGYTQTTCVVSGNLVRIHATYLYSFVTPFLRSAFGSLTITTDATELVE